MAEYDPTFDAYKVLGIDPKAPQKDIRPAFYALTEQNAPDLAANKADAEKRTARQAEINRAYELIKTPQRRREYDAQRRPARAAAQRAVEQVVPERVRDEFSQRIADVIAGVGRTPGTVPAPPRGPGRQAPPADTPRRPDIWTRPGPRDRGDTGRTDTAPSRPAAEETIFRQAQNTASRIRKEYPEWIREGDVIALDNGRYYIFLHVNCGTPGGPAGLYKPTPVPILCRGDEAFLDPAAYTVAPGQGLRLAREATCRTLLKDEAEISASVAGLAHWREATYAMVEELSDAIRGKEIVQMGASVVYRRDVRFSGEREAVSVLCIGDQVLELRKGAPVSDNMRYADAATLRWLHGNDNYLWLIASQQAKENGHPVSALNARRARNTVRSLFGGRSIG